LVEISVDGVASLGATEAVTAEAHGPEQVERCTVRPWPSQSANAGNYLNIDIKKLLYQLK
jgi:hypothetical protein